jgi:hypothetical protein
MVHEPPKHTPPTIDPRAGESVTTAPMSDTVSVGGVIAVDLPVVCVFHVVGGEDVGGRAFPLQR